MVVLGELLYNTVGTPVNKGMQDNPVLSGGVQHYLKTMGLLESSWYWKKSCGDSEGRSCIHIEKAVR